jgi:hypothetical protein
MKYFTPQFWLSMQSPNWERSSKRWNRRFESYKKELSKILPMMASSGREFFGNPLVLHDGKLTRFEAGDQIATPTSDYARGYPGSQVRLYVISDRVQQRCYVLRYKEVSRINLSLPGEKILFPTGSDDFHHWGYDELSLRGSGIFRHEILFASGATILIDFQQFSCQKLLPTTRKRAGNNAIP